MKSAHKISGPLLRYLSSLAGLLFLSPIALWAESCPFCYAKAASSSPGLFQALRSGIIILMIPPMLMSVGFTVVAYRRRNSFHSSR